ncbi:MAG: dicarboxylate/amino acid:cation symporter [Flavobacteriales bacterium]|nr:dicarboxylate/amino acid:cation symporter [Flavobacteriales bacterium]
MRKMALHWQILSGMFLGVVLGAVAATAGHEQFITRWVNPFGVIFMNLLKLIAVPLVFASLVKGVSSLSDITKLSRIGTRTIGIYLTTTVIAVTLGLVFVNVTNPGKSFSPEKRQELQAQYAANVEIGKTGAQGVKDAGPLQFLVDMVPSNFIDAATNNGKMLQVIFFSLLFGIAMVMLPEENTRYVKGFFDGVNDIILKIVDIIMLYAPFGVLALMAGVIVDFSDSLGELFQALGVYSLTVVAGLAVMVLLIYPLILKLFTKVKYGEFFKGIMPAQLLAFSTSSSAATLPVTMERCEEHLGVSKEVSSFVLPVGATINMDGTSLYQAVAAVFIAQAFGYDLHLSDQLTIIMTATLASIGTAAVPGAGLIMLIIVLGGVGVEPEGIALVIAVDRLLDMCRTVVNVTGDATVATVIASTEGKLQPVTEDD